MFTLKKIKNGLLYFAAISLEVQRKILEPSLITENYSGQGFKSQGLIEDVPHYRYSDWKLGVQSGLQYAISKTNKNWFITINKLHGLSTDTNPTITGYVAINAFWEKVKYKPEGKELDRLEKFVFDSWNYDFINQRLIPDFYKLTYKK